MAGLNRRQEDRGRVQYRPRTMEDVKEQTEQQGGSFDSIFKSNVDMFKPADGENTVRFCQPTWPDAHSYSYEIWVHYNVGPRGGTYLCPKKMRNKRCPICEAEADALQHGEKEDAEGLKIKKRKVAWIIDRDGDSDWPCIWSFGWTLDRDIGALLPDRKRGTVLQIDHPDNGYDVSFQRQTGKDVKNTKYFGFMIDREPSPLLPNERDQDEVINFLEQNPIPDMLKFYGADYLEELVSGTAGEDNDDDDDYNSNERDDDMATKAKSTRAGGGRGREEAAAPRGGGRGREETRRSGRGREDPPDDDRDTRARGRDDDDTRGARGRGDDDTRGGRDRDRDDARGGGRDREDDRRGGGRDRDDDRAPSRSARGSRDDDENLPFDADEYDADGDPETSKDRDDDRGGDRDDDDRGSDRDDDRGGRSRTARGGERGGRSGDDSRAGDDRADRSSRTSRKDPPREQGRRSSRR